VWSLGEPASGDVVRRTEIDEILMELSRGRRWFLIHSHLGNGKTVLKQQLSHVLSRFDYKVFWDSDFDLNREGDIRHLSIENGKIAIFIDESPDRFEVIDGLLSLNTANITVFVCVRTTLYELGESRYEAFLPDDYIPFDLNKLSNDDVRGFVSLFSNLGLWGTRAALSDTEKENFVKVECSRGISNVILSIFEKSEVGDRITLLSKLLLNEKSDTAALIILSFLMNRIGHPPRLSTLSEILNIDVWKIVKVTYLHTCGRVHPF
jgi:hypothetical protein